MRQTPLTERYAAAGQWALKLPCGSSANRVTILTQLIRDCARVPFLHLRLAVPRKHIRQQVLGKPLCDTRRETCLNPRSGCRSPLGMTAQPEPRSFIKPAGKWLRPISFRINQEWCVVGTIFERGTGYPMHCPQRHEAGSMLRNWRCKCQMEALARNIHPAFQV